MKKIVFLDIDNVLNTCQQSEYFCIQNIEALNILLAYTNAFVVLTSTWRVASSTEEWNNTFKSLGILPRIIDKTPEYYDLREIEIILWLKKVYKKIPKKGFVILDDLPFTVLFKKHIQTSPKTGLTLEQSKKAIHLLNTC